MQPRAWSGSAELFVYRSGERQPITIEMELNSSLAPGRSPGWSGSFLVEPFAIVGLGKSLIRLGNGREAEVMVEGFDTVTGKGYFFGTSEPPF